MFSAPSGHSVYILRQLINGWVQEIAISADVHYCIYADIVGGFKKIQKWADNMDGS